MRDYKKRFTVQGESNTGFEDLQKGPVVLLGAYTNEWTIQLTQSMRFRFDLNPNTLEAWIADQKNPDVKLGLVELGNNESLNNQEDIALVARVVDSETKQPFIVIAGVTPSGTRVAGEFVTNPQYLSEFLKTSRPTGRRKTLIGRSDSHRLLRNSKGGESLKIKRSKGRCPR